MKDFTPCQCLKLVWEHWEDLQLLGELMQLQFLLCPCSIPNPSQMCLDALEQPGRRVLLDFSQVF